MGSRNLDVLASPHYGKRWCRMNQFDTQHSDIGKHKPNPGSYLKLSKDSVSKSRCWAHLIPQHQHEEVGMWRRGSLAHYTGRREACIGRERVQFTSDNTWGCPPVTHHTQAHLDTCTHTRDSQRLAEDEGRYWLQESEEIPKHEDAPIQCRERIRGPRTKCESWDVELFITLNESHWAMISESDSVWFPDFQPSSRHLCTLFEISTLYYFGCWAASWLCQLLCDSNIPFRRKLTAPR